MKNNKLLKYFKTQEQFDTQHIYVEQGSMEDTFIDQNGEEQWGEPDIYPEHICFIEDTKTIFTHNTKYVCLPSDSDNCKKTTILDILKFYDDTTKTFNESYINDNGDEVLLSDENGYLLATDILLEMLNDEYVIANTLNEFDTRLTSVEAGDNLSQGTNISIDNNTISAVGYKYDSTKTSFATGYETEANGEFSFAAGRDSKANGQCASAIGDATEAIGDSSHSEGSSSYAEGNYSHAEGSGSHAQGVSSHAEGSYSHAEGPSSHAEGYVTHAQGTNSHTEGEYTETFGRASHAEGYKTTAFGKASHSEGNGVEAVGVASHAEGWHDIDSANSATYIVKQDEVDNTKYYIVSDFRGVTGESGEILYLKHGMTFLCDDEYYCVTEVFYDETNPNNPTSFRLNQSIGRTDTNDFEIKLVLGKSIGQGSHIEGCNTVAYGDYSHAEGNTTRAVGDYSHTEGVETCAVGVTSHAEGRNCVAIGDFTHAEGNYTKAIGVYSHTEGNFTTAKGWSSHAEGNSTTAIGDGSHAEGYNTKSEGNYSHVEGDSTTTIGDSSHAEGKSTTAHRIASHAEGKSTTAIGEASHAEGKSTTAIGEASHAEGNTTTAEGLASHTEGIYAKATGNYSHAEGNTTLSIGEASHAEGRSTTAEGYASHAEGNSTKTIGYASHSEGNNTIALGFYSHTEGVSTTAEGQASHAEGNGTKAIGVASHTEGELTITNGQASHAEGNNTKAIGNYSHAEGLSTTAEGPSSHTEGDSTKTVGQSSHAEGSGTTSMGFASHAEGHWTTAHRLSSHAEGISTNAEGEASHSEGNSTKTVGTASHAEGVCTIATNEGEHAEGKFNITNVGTISSIGIGTSDTERKNAFEVMTDGSIYINGLGEYDGTNAVNPNSEEKIGQSLQEYIKENELPKKVNELIYFEETNENTGFVSKQLMYSEGLVVDNDEDFLLCKQDADVSMATVSTDWKVYGSEEYSTYWGYCDSIPVNPGDTSKEVILRNNTPKNVPIYTCDGKPQDYIFNVENTTYLTGFYSDKKYSEYDSITSAGIINNLKNTGNTDYMAVVPAIHYDENDTTSGYGFCGISLSVNNTSNTAGHGRENVGKENHTVSIIVWKQDINQAIQYYTGNTNIQLLNNIEGQRISKYNSDISNGTNSSSYSSSILTRVKRVGNLITMWVSNPYRSDEDDSKHNVNVDTPIVVDLSNYTLSYTYLKDDGQYEKVIKDFKENSDTDIQYVNTNGELTSYSSDIKETIRKIFDKLRGESYRGYEVLSNPGSIFRNLTPDETILNVTQGDKFNTTWRYSQSVKDWVNETQSLGTPMQLFSGSRLSFNRITNKLFYSDGVTVYQIASLPGSDSSSDIGDNSSSISSQSFGGYVYIEKYDKTDFENALTTALTEAKTEYDNGTNKNAIILDCTYFTGTHILSTGFNGFNLETPVKLVFGSIKVVFNNPGDHNLFNILHNDISIVGINRNTDVSQIASVDTDPNGATLFIMNGDSSNSSDNLNGYHIKSSGYKNILIDSITLKGKRSAMGEYYNSTNSPISGIGGIYIEKGDPAGTATSGLTCNNVRINNVLISDTKAHGIYINTPILSSITNTRLSGCGGHGIYILGGTSINMENVYASSGNFAGFCIQNASYVQLANCVAETFGIGFLIRGSNSVTLHCPGVEQTTNYGRYPWRNTLTEEKTSASTNSNSGIYGLGLLHTGSTEIIKDVVSGLDTCFIGYGIYITGGDGINVFSPYIKSIGQSKSNTIGYPSGTTPSAQLNFISVVGTANLVNIINPHFKMSDEELSIIETIKNEIKIGGEAKYVDISYSTDSSPLKEKIEGVLKHTTSSSDKACIYTEDGENGNINTITLKIDNVYESLHTKIIYSENGVFETSDARKKDVQGELSLDKAYDFIRNCEPILYNLKGSDKTQIGLIAQDVREFFPEIVNEDNEGYLSLDYTKLSVIMLRVLKDLIDKK